MYEWGQEQIEQGRREAMDINASEKVNQLRRAVDRYQEIAANDTDYLLRLTLSAADDLVDAADAVLDILLDENGLPPTLKQWELLTL